MEFLIHVVTTSIVLLVISKLLRGFEVDNWVTALIAALILGILHAFLEPFSIPISHFIAGLLANTDLANTLKHAIQLIMMLIINALFLKLASAIGPGFRISNFGNALLGALLFAFFNGLIGIAFDLL